MLLADIFENFRQSCLKTYELDPAHFVSLPGLAWQACLKKTNVELEFLTDYDTLLMVEEGIRGGGGFVMLFNVMLRRIINIGMIMIGKRSPLRFSI